MKNSSRQLLTLAPLLLVIIVDTMGFGLIIPILSPLFMERVNPILPLATSVPVRDFLYGLTLAGFTTTMLFGAPLLGDLSDYVGRKKVLIISLVGTACALMVSAVGILFHSVALLIGGRCLAGFAAGSQPIAQAAIADLSTPETKAKHMAWLGFAACLGFVLGPVIGGYFANPKFFNYATPFFIAAFLATLNAIAVKFTFRETFVTTAPRAKIHWSKGLVLFWQAFLQQEIRAVITAALIYQVGFAIYLTFISLFIVQVFGYSTLQVGHFMAYFGIILAITYIVVVPTAVRWMSLSHVIKVSLGMTFLGMIALIWPKPWVVWFSLIPIAAGNGLSYTATLALLSNQTSLEKQGWIMGVLSSVSAAAWGIGSLVAGGLGMIHQLFPFIMAAFLTLLGLFIFTITRR